jgi:hypothetical protein
MKTLFKIPAGNVPRLQERIADLAKRAARVAKKGDLLDATPIGLIVGEKVVEPRKDPHTNLPLPPAIYYMVEVTGATPKLAGWTFVATLQHEEGGTILRAVPTVELPEGALKPYREAVPSCDHCGYKRRRNDTFVVRNDAGTMKQVGRNCLADFTGCKSPQAVASMAEYLAAAAGVAEEFEGGGGGGEFVEDMTAYLAYVAAAIRLEGWLSRTKAREFEGGRQATANVAWGWMHPTPMTPAKDRVVPEEKDVKLASEALAWVDAHLSEQDPDKLNDYEHNLRVAVAGGVVTFRLAGIAGSLVPYFERAMGRELFKAKAKAVGYVGTVGKRETFTLELLQVFSIDGNFGVQHIHKFVTSEGAVVIWKTGTDKLESGTYKVKGTVKAHNEFRGEPQTILTRCAVEKVEAPATCAGS